MDDYHGTHSGYSYRGCRCDRCKKANTDYQRARRIKLEELETPDDVHGTTNGYINYNCRCNDCVGAGYLYRMQYYYGLSILDVAVLLVQQEEKCYICRKDLYKLDIHVDHDHKCCPGKKSCGKCIRSLLCGNCNKALGLVKEDPKVLEAMRAYVENPPYVIQIEPVMR